MEVSDQIHTVAVLLLRRGCSIHWRGIRRAPDQEWNGNKE